MRQKPTFVALVKRHPGQDFGGLTGSIRGLIGSLVLLALCLGPMKGLGAPAANNRSSIAPAVTAGPGLEEFIRLYQSDDGSVERFYDLPWAPARFDRLEKLFKEWQERLEAVDFAGLDQQGRIDYLLLRNRLSFEFARLGLGRERLGEMEALLPFRKAVQDLERGRWGMGAADSQANAAAVAGIPDQIKQIRQRIEEGRKEKEEKAKPAEDSKAEAAKDNATPKREGAKIGDQASPLKLSAALARRAAAAVGDLRGTLKTWFSFYDGYQPDFSWWLKKPYDEASSALEDYAKFLREEIAGLKGKDEDPLIGDPVGATALAADLEAEMIPYTPEELIEIAEKEFVWCEGKMKEMANKMDLGDDWKAALTKVKGDFAPPGKQDELVAEEAHRAIRFVKEHDLVTVPPLCEETWRLTMISPEGQKTMPYVAYGGQNMMVAYAKEEMKHEDKLMSMRGNNRHFTRITTAHELIPGHHLQSFVAGRSRPYRSLFSTPFLVEGWSLYWEMQLWDLDYGQSPEDRIGMLFWRMHRSARVIVSLKFHLGKMTPAEMVGFLVDRVGHEKLGATSEVRRFIAGDYSPLYQCAYMIGGLQLRALHHELVGPGKMSEWQFHDTVLSYNAIPVELIRAGMFDVPLARDARPTWRFAEESPKGK